MKPETVLEAIQAILDSATNNDDKIEKINHQCNDFRLKLLLEKIRSKKVKEITIKTKDGDKLITATPIGDYLAYHKRSDGFKGYVLTHIATGCFFYNGPKQKCVQLGKYLALEYPIDPLRSGNDGEEINQEGLEILRNIVVKFRNEGILEY